MIASLSGIVKRTSRDSLVLFVNGIGYKVFVPFTLLDHSLEAEPLELHTSLVVREDSLSLFGFATLEERDTFETLLSISGIGPKSALAILSVLTLDNLRNAVVGERAEILTRVPGIGKKTAQRILIDLKDKLHFGLDTAPVQPFDDLNSDVIDALVGLGYSIVEAQTAVQSLPADAPATIEDRVRLALQYFT